MIIVSTNLEPPSKTWPFSLFPSVPLQKEIFKPPSRSTKSLKCVYLPTKPWRGLASKKYIFVKTPVSYNWGFSLVLGWTLPLKFCCKFPVLREYELCCWFSWKWIVVSLLISGFQVTDTKIIRYRIITN